MATFSQNDITSLFLGQAATKTTGTIGAMNDGEIGIFTPAGTRLTEATAATADEFVIVKKTANGGVPLISSVIKKASIVSATRALYAAAVQKTVNIGYDGTSGSIDVANDTTYHVRVNMREGRTSNHGGLYVKHGFMTSDLSATELEIASELLVALGNEFSKEPGKTVVTTLLSDDAGAATTVATGTISVVEGSKFASASVSATAELEVGGLLRLGTATTDEVYVIASLSGTTIELESRVTSATADYTAGNAEFVTAALAAAASYGLVLTGVEQTHRVGKLHGDLQPVDFDVTLQNFGTTALTETAAYAGNGTEKQIKEFEFFCQGNEGDYFRMGEPNLFDSRVEASGNYDMINIYVEEVDRDHLTNGTVHKNYFLAVPEGASTPNYALSATADDITDVLEVLVYGSANTNLSLG